MILVDLLNIIYGEIPNEETDTDELEQEQEQESEEETNPEEEVLSERELAELYQAQEDLDYLLNDPVIAQRIMELNTGKTETKPVEQPKPIDETEAMKNPANYLRQLVAEAVRTEVGSVVKSELGNLQTSLQPLLQDNYERQAMAEFSAVQKANPTVKGVTMNSVLNTLSRHPTLTMEDAFWLNARQKNATVESKGKPPILERSSKRTTSSTKEEQLLKERGTDLRKRAEEAEKQGIGIRAIAMKFLRGEG